MNQVEFKSGPYWAIFEAFGYRVIVSFHRKCLTRPLEFETVTNYSNQGTWEDRFVFFGPFNFAIGKLRRYRCKTP